MHLRESQTSDLSIMRISNASTVYASCCHQTGSTMGLNCNPSKKIMSIGPILTLIKENWLRVANEDQLQLKIVKKIHDQPAVGHPSTKKILEMAQRYYYWPGIKEMIQQFIRNCHVCKQAKAARDTYYDLLQPLLVLEQAWIDISMDFVVRLPKYKAYRQIYDAILIVINRLSKERHYIPCSKENERTSAEMTADLFLWDV